MDNQSAEVGASAKDSTSSPWNERLFQLGRYKAELPAAPANVGAFPVPTELGINLSVIAGNSAKVEEHTCKTRRTNKKENDNRFSKSCC